MGRSYAGILGPLALLTTLARGWLAGGDVCEVVFQAWCSLLVFAAVGCVVGRVAGWVVDDAVRGQLAAAMAARKAGSEQRG